MKKLTKAFLGAAFVVVLLSSLFIAAPASAGADSFSYAGEPSDANGICAYGTEIYDFAVAETNSNIIYAATSDNALKSVNQGRTWTKIHAGPAGTDVAGELVAIAGDDADIVAYASNVDLHVRISLNGGVSFFDLGIPANQASSNTAKIFDIDISKEFTDLYGYSYRYVGVAGVDGDAGTGNASFYYCQVGAWAPFDWYDAVTDFVPAATGYTDDDLCFFAVKFSPSFGIDNIAYLLSQDVSTTDVELHVCSLNIPGDFDANISGYNMYNLNPVDGGTLVCALAPAVGVTKGQIIFDPGYSGVYYSPYARTAFCSVAANVTGNGGAFRITENASAQPVVSTIIGAVSIWSIGLNAAGDYCVAAAAYDSTVYRSSAPLWGIGTTASLPIKRIGGGPLVPFGGVTTLTDNQTIFFAGANVLCAKAGDMGAFSLSVDNGYTFNDISLVNTWTTVIRDKAIKADGTQRYVVVEGDSLIAGVPAGTNHTSIFYWDGTYWWRVFVRDDVDDYVVRASPVSFGTVYLGDKTNATVYYTSTYGMEDWRFRQAPKVATALADIEVVDDATFYVAVNFGGNGYVCPLNYSGLYWNASDYIQVFGGATIASISLVSDEEVAAGSTVGNVAYTTTGGNTPSEWTQIAPLVGGGGNVFVDATSLAPGSPIYAVDSASTAVWVYFAGSGAAAWFPAYFSAIATPTASLDIFIYGGCVYYACSGTDGVPVTTVGLARAFTSTAWMGLGWGVVYYNAGAVGATAGYAPDVLKGSADASGILGNQIWFIDTAAAAKYAIPMKQWGSWTTVTMFNVIYTDQLAVVPPTLVSPIDKYIVQVNKETGIAYDTVLQWTHAVSGLPFLYTYQLQVALDPAFTILVISVGGATSPTIIGPWVAAPFTLVYQPGEIYYWRVRATTPLFSAWSGVRELDIQAAPYPAPVLEVPVNGGTVGTSTVSFSWSPMSGTAIPSGITTTYSIWVGSDPNFAAGTYDEYTATNTTGLVIPDMADGTYYWRVCTDVAPHTNWSSTNVFTVDIVGPVTVTQTTGPATVAVPSNATQTTIEQTSPAFIWAIIIIGAVLVIAIIVLIFRTRSK